MTNSKNRYVPSIGLGTYNMTPEEAESSYWTYQPILLILDDGTAICPMSDDEGNEAGSIACMGEKVEVETIPVMRERI